MPEITKSELADFRRYKKYKSILGGAFRITVGLFTETGLTRNEISCLVKYIQNRNKINEMFDIRNGSITFYLSPNGTIGEDIDIRFKKRNR